MKLIQIQHFGNNFYNSILTIKIKDYCFIAYILTFCFLLKNYSKHYLVSFLGETTSEIMKVAIKVRAHALGPFRPSIDLNKMLYEGLVKILPDDAHKRATGRLHISVTRVSDDINVIINQFDSKEELIQVFTI